MNALVISGGGAKGAFAGGVAEHLIKKNGKNYDLFVGTSTGSLLAPFLAIGEIDRIKKLYTTIEQSDIFSVCPFKVRYKNGQLRIRINHLGIIGQFLKGHKTLGDSSNLRKMIHTHFTREDFDRISALGKEVVVTVANLTTLSIEYKSSKDYDYPEFCDWIWASCNMVPLMSIYRSGGFEYADGGFGNLIPIQQAIALGATVIDTIVLRLEKSAFNEPLIQNAIDAFARTTDFMLNEIANDDVAISKIMASEKRAQLTFYHVKRILTTRSFVFNKTEMAKWWKEGFESLET